ncbi:hypothetical protein MFFC18_08580 [Mariniblastus fucicola]|uniref:ScoMcrA-like N-terminal head domain-containing protein n=1 Tax=Mariniblastus fucicola TaxID=980251 RepID=A0A5B9P8R1_9BACT|nr:hypothetical protein MFFC18_08580 [Mariniblastus fucicola]
MGLVRHIGRAIYVENYRDDSVIPDDISRAEVLKGIKEFLADGFPTGFKKSHTYELAHEDARYPPPVILALAIKAKTGSLPATKFRAGEKTKCFEVLRSCGFEIVRIADDDKN